MFAKPLPVTAYVTTGSASVATIIGTVQTSKRRKRKRKGK